MIDKTPVWVSVLYRTAWALAMPVVFARFWWRGRVEPAYRERWAQRLGHWATRDLGSSTSGAGPRVWLHAVSLGETRAAQPLVNALRQCLPGMQLLLTTSTATGWEAGKSLLQTGDLHGWVPLDTVAATRRFLVTLRPTVGILMETETWPNLVAQAQACGVPLLLANARLSERSLRKGRRWPALTRPMMASLAGILAQTREDAERFLAVGAHPDRVQVTGNLKFDLEPPADAVARGLDWKAGATPCPGVGSLGSPPNPQHPSNLTRLPNAARRIVLAASWREGEDAPLLRAWKSECDAALKAGQALAHRPLLLVVPRHPQRFDEVHAALRSAGWSVSRRSTWGPEGPADHDWTADAWLGDSIGEMAAYYALADVALLGGSFAPLGGQNLIEAAACGCPVITGPHTFNFEDAAQRAVEEGAALRASDLEDAVQRALALPMRQLQAHRAAAHAFFERHAGAAARQAQCVAQRLGSAAQQR